MVVTRSASFTQAWRSARKICSMVGLSKLGGGGLVRPSLRWRSWQRSFCCCSDILGWHGDRAYGAWPLLVACCPSERSEVSYVTARSMFSYPDLKLGHDGCRDSNCRNIIGFFLQAWIDLLCCLFRRRALCHLASLHWISIEACQALRSLVKRPLHYGDEHSSTKDSSFFWRSADCLCLWFGETKLDLLDTQPTTLTKTP